MVQPVHAIGGKIDGRIAVAGGRVLNVSVEWHHRIEGVRPKGEPVNPGNGGRHVVTDLEDVELQVPVEGDRPVRSLAVSLIRIIWGALVMRAHHLLDVLDGNLVPGVANERQVLVGRLYKDKALGVKGVGVVFLPTDDRRAVQGRLLPPANSQHRLTDFQSSIWPVKVWFTYFLL